MLSAIFGVVVSFLMGFLRLFSAGDTDLPSNQKVQVVAEAKQGHHSYRMPPVAVQRPLEIPESMQRPDFPVQPTPIELPKDTEGELARRAIKPGPMPELMGQDPRDAQDIPEMLEFSRKEKELTQYLKQVDLSGSLNEKDMDKLWELQDLYGFALSDNQMRDVLARRPKNLDEFVEFSGEAEDQLMGQQ
jgi:hypothetical protein